jgi:hypothetical protein
MLRVLPFLVFIFIGLGSLGLSGFLVWRQRAFTERSLAVEGTIVSSTSYRPSNGGDLKYSAMVDWKDREGHPRKYELTGDFSYTVGSKVVLRYDPQSPDDVRTDGGLTMPALIFGFIGVVFLGIVIKVAAQGQKA